MEMRYAYVTAFLLGLVMNANAQDLEFVQFKYDDKVVSSEGYMLDGKPEGYWKTYYPDGTLKSEGNRLNHQLDSIWKFYAPDGVLQQSIWYREGKKNGQRLTFYENGVLMKKETFRNDVRVDTVFRYHPSGNVAAAVPLDTLGKGIEHGVGYEYDDEDGRVTAVVTYRNGYIAGRERINRKDKFNQKQGPWRYFYPNMVTREEGRYRNDKKHGYWKTYDENGELIETLKYEDGILIPDPVELAKLDIKREYHPNAQVRTEGSYNKGVKEGVHRWFSPEGEVVGAKVYSKGELIGEGIVDEQGKRQGPWKEYYPTGELRSEGAYRNGLREGEWIFYYRSGKVEQKGSYYRGKPDGDWVWTYENGQTWRTETYADGLEEGLAIEYNDTGKVIAQGSYIGGEKDGKWMIDVGDQREEGTYVAGSRNGVWQVYYPSGKLKYEGKYEQGQESGKHTEYYENGQVKEVGQYKFGSKEGDWYMYNEEGIQISVITYKNNRPVRIDGQKINEPDDLID